MSRRQSATFNDGESFPRVSGDEPLGKPKLCWLSLFSPRERG